MEEKKHIVFGIHREDKQAGQKFLQFLQENFKEGDTYKFEDLTYFILENAADYKKALNYGRRYCSKVLNSDDEIFKSVELNPYGEKRQIGSISLFAVQIMPLTLHTNWRDDKYKKYNVNKDMGILDLSVNDCITKLDSKNITDLPFNIYENLKFMAEKLNIDIKNIYTKYGYGEHTLEVLYADKQSEINQIEFKAKVSEFLKDYSDKLLSDNHIEGIIETNKYGEFGNLIFENNITKSTGI